MSVQTPQERAAETESLIARTALRYDLLPYESNPFPQSQPSRLAAVARIFGLEATPLAQARMLELGCASGGNFLPLAATYPDAHFTGIDLSRTQVAAGRARIDRLSLKNAQILCKSFTEIGPELGLFDYIICHGVYSWVPEAVRSAILEVVQRHLSPNGVAYISYNVLPGWRMLQPLRDIFVSETAGITDSHQRVAKARQILESLRTATASGAPYGAMLKSWGERLPFLADDYIEHEFLAEINEPCLMRDFVGNAARHNLAYLGDADLPMMILDNQGEATANRIRELSQNDLLASEHYLDMVNGRTFRQTLLVHAARQNAIVRALSPQSMKGVHFLGSADMKVERTEAGGTLTDSAGRQLTSRSGEVMAALALLAAAYPASVSIEDMVETLPKAKRTAQWTELVQQSMLQATIVGLTIPSSEPVRLASSASERPVALAHVRSDTAGGSASVTNGRHERVNLDPAAKALLPLMDGTKTKAKLAAHLAHIALAGEVNFNRGGEKVEGREAIVKIAAEHIGPVLQGLARSGLLSA